MTDLDREMRALLEDDAQHTPPIPEAAPVLRRTRRRQVGVALATVAVVAALALGSLAGVAALVRTSDRRIPIGPVETPSPPALAAGALEALPLGTDWSFDTTVDANGVIWAIGPGLNRFDPETGASTAFTLADDPAFGYVVAIAPAREGGVWIVSSSSPYRPWQERPIATTVRRFDGVGFRETLDEGPVCDVAEGPDGTLWGTGCSAGLYRWDGSSWASVPTGGALIADGLAVADGAVWLANVEYGSDGWVNAGLGLSRFDGSVWTTWTTSDGLPSDRIRTIVPGPDGEVWVGTDDGVARYLNGSWSAYPGTFAGVESVSSIAVVDGSIWIAGSNGQPGGMARFDGNEWIPVTSGDGLGEIGPHPSVAVGDQGVLWASTNRSGLFRFDGSRWERVAPDGSTELYQIAAVSSDELWAGAWHLEAGSWSEDADLADAGVGEMAVAPDGVPWAITDRGVERFDGSSWVVVKEGAYSAIDFAPDGTPWTARWRVSPVDGHPLPDFNPLPGEAADLAIAPNGDIWLHCSGFYSDLRCDRTVAYFDGEAWETMEPTGLPEGAILRELEIEGDGDVWYTATTPDASAWTLVVARYRDGTWTEVVETDQDVRLDERPGLGASAKLVETPDGGLLLLANDGLYALSGDLWTLAAGGAFSDVSVAPDGTIWLAGDGLFRMPA